MCAADRRQDATPSQRLDRLVHHTLQLRKEGREVALSAPEDQKDSLMGSLCPRDKSPLRQVIHDLNPYVGCGVLDRLMVSWHTAPFRSGSAA